MSKELTDGDPPGRLAAGGGGRPGRIGAVRPGIAADRTGGAADPAYPFERAGSPRRRRRLLASRHDRRRPGRRRRGRPAAVVAAGFHEPHARRGRRDPGQLLRSFLDPAAKPASPWPCSAALVRISKSRGNWLAALSFHPRRLFPPVDLKLMLLARRQLLNHRQQTQVYEKLKESLFGLVRCLTAAIDAKDPYTWGHSERVARMAVRLARQMDLPPAVQSDLYLAGLLHDVGKIGVRDEVLRKPGPLTPEEEAHVQEHPVIGDRLVCHIKPLQHLRWGVRNHHERWDGRGYPDGLAGDDIPLQARILAVADSCDAMMHTRPYRASLPTDRVEEILRDGAGSQWDPHVVAAFQVCRQDLYSICQRGLGDSVFVAVERA